MLTIESKLVRLTECSRADIRTLYHWRISPIFLNTCTQRRHLSFLEFCREIRNDFKTDRHEQYMIYSRNKSEAMGTIYSYGGNEIDSSVFVSIYIASEFQKKGIGVYAFATYIKYLFESKNIKQILFDVYATNHRVLDIFCKTHLKQYLSISEHTSKDRKIFRFVFSDEHAVVLSRFL